MTCKWKYGKCINGNMIQYIQGWQTPTLHLLYFCAKLCVVNNTNLYRYKNFYHIYACVTPLIVLPLLLHNKGGMSKDCISLPISSKDTVHRCLELARTAPGSNVLLSSRTKDARGGKDNQIVPLKTHTQNCLKQQSYLTGCRKQKTPSSEKHFTEETSNKWHNYSREDQNTEEMCCTSTTIKSTRHSDQLSHHLMWS